MQEQLIDRVPLADLDAIYPGYNFMKLTYKIDDSKTLVGTRLSITRQPLYAELPLEETDEPAALAAEIVVLLDRKADKARKQGKNYITGYYTPEEWQQIKRAEKEEEHIV